MKLTDINIRDPFIILENGKYYMFGTRGGECWGKGTGLDVYTSDDLNEWSEPQLAFAPPADFWADRNFWAPEVHKYKGKYYMFVSFKSETRHRGTQVLISDTPEGPYRVHGEKPITPEDWECLDGTFYLSKDGTPYMVFCHEWTQVGDGEVCAIKMNDDLTASVGEPMLLFKASSAEWIRSVTGKPGDYVTDGPFMYRSGTGDLYMLWAADDNFGYVEALAKSDNGEIDGNWTQVSRLVDHFSGGHGMIFTAKDGTKKLTMHSPDTSRNERPYLFELIEKDGEPTVVR